MGLVAPLVLYAVDGPAPAWASADAAVAQSPVGPPTGSGVCIVRQRAGARSSSSISSATGIGTPPGPRGGGAGDVTVAIPPVVLIRPHNHRLVVTTNTGGPPQPQDAFYYIVHHTAHLARPALRQRVLSKCAR